MLVADNWKQSINHDDPSNFPGTPLDGWMDQQMITQIVVEEEELSESFVNQRKF